MDLPAPSSAKSQPQRRFQEQHGDPHPTEVSFLIPSSAQSVSLPEEGEQQVVTTTPEGTAGPAGQQLFRHDSEFSVGSNYEYSSPNNLQVWQGAALLTADCLGTGILALPGDIQVLGYGFGLGFLIANLPINLYAGTILSRTATHVEESQGVANRLYHESQSLSDPLLLREEEGDGDNNMNYEAINANTTTSKESMCTYHTQQTQHTQLHHDTATFDFIGVTQALFHDKAATRLVMVIYYVNIFLVLGNYILVQAHAVQAAFGGALCLPTAGLIASTGMFVVVSQSRTMARLGRTASILSLSALLIVVVQCIVAAHTQQQQQQQQQAQDADAEQPRVLFESEHSTLRKLSALGSIGFAVGSQKLFLNIRHELGDRKAAPRSLAMSLAAFGTFYLIVVLAAGSNPPAFLFDAIPAGTLNRRIAGLLLWAHVAVSYAINSQAICSSMDRLIGYRDTTDTLSMSSSQRWLLLTCLMAAAAYTVANAIPFFQDLVALIGAITSVPLTLLLPAVFWRKYMAVPIWKPTRDSLYSYSLLVFAVVFMVAATVGSVYSIQQDWSAHGPPFSCL